MSVPNRRFGTEFSGGVASGDAHAPRRRSRLRATSGAGAPDPT